MGLAGRKEKQRFGIDPQNKQWQNNKDAIGFKLLSQMGWQEGKGLGKDLEGMSENIKLKLKNNNYGIGATARTGDNWLESSFGFDDLLKGLGGDDNCDMTDSSTLLIIPSAASASNEGDHDAANTTDAVKETMAPSSSGRHLHRRKFIQNKKVTSFDAAQVNNILGKTRTGQIQHPNDKDDQSSSNRDQDSKLEKKNLDVDAGADNSMNAVIPTVVKNVSVNDYFAQKMAAKGLSLAGMLSGISEQVAPTLYNNAKMADQEIDEEEATLVVQEANYDDHNQTSKLEENGMKKKKKSKKDKKRNSEKARKRSRSSEKDESDEHAAGDDDGENEKAKKVKRKKEKKSKCEK